MSLIVSIYGCEDQIDVNLPDNDQRLVVNAIIKVDRSFNCVPFVVYTSLSSGYFEENEPVNVTSIRLIIESYNEFGDTESSSTIELYESDIRSGVYYIDGCLSQETFNSELGYFLSIRYNNRHYFARTTFITGTTINHLEQGENYLINEDEVELTVNFSDDPNKQNFYIFDFGRGIFEATDDFFFQGQNHTFSVFIEDTYEPGDTAKVVILGADREFYNYMTLLIEQTDNALNIFETPAATVRGNIFDITDIDNRDQFDNVEATDGFALGYFAIVESNSKSIVIQ